MHYSTSQNLVWNLGGNVGHIVVIIRDLVYVAMHTAMDSIWNKTFNSAIFQCDYMTVYICAMKLCFFYNILQSSKSVHNNT